MSHPTSLSPPFAAPHRLLTELLVLVVLGLVSPFTPLLAQEPLTLRLSDTEVRPGALAAVVIRTYAPRGVGQGQLCMRAIEPPAAPFGDKTAAEGLGHPFTALEDVVVFSGAGDAVSANHFDPLSQTAVLSFESLSGTINSTDGPLAVLFFRLDAGVAPGSLFDLRIDPGDTFMIDDEGQTVPLEIRSGELEVLAPGAPFSLGAEGDRAAPGGIAHVGVASAEHLLLGSGVVTFVYEPTIAGGPVTVTLDPRHGASVASVDSSIPGRVTVSFDSPDGSLNTVPGTFVSILLPIRADATIGTLSPVSIDPASTIDDAAGNPLVLALAGDVIEIVPPDVLFADDFESGDLSNWSLVSP